MASKTATIAANDLANHYVVGADEVGIPRKLESDYLGYVHDMAPLLDDLLITGNQVINERKTLGLPTW